MQHLPGIYAGNDLMPALLAWGVPVASLAMPMLVKTGANPVPIVYGLAGCGKTAAARFGAMGTGMLKSQIQTGWLLACFVVGDCMCCVPQQQCLLGSACSCSGEQIHGAASDQES